MIVDEMALKRMVQEACQKSGVDSFIIFFIDNGKVKSLANIESSDLAPIAASAFFSKKK